jgi:hypothetical protein
VTGTLISGPGVGIDDRTLPDADILVVGSTVTGHSIGIGAPFVKLRATVVSDNAVGVLVTRSARFSDLGQPFGPGNNRIVNNRQTGVTFNQDVIATGFGAVFASGNTWNATQGADGSGHYPSQPLVTGDSPNARGTNFQMPSAAGLFEIHL